jgi:predicted transcriptional regulator
MFEDLPTLISVMTPRRMELLRTLRQNGPLSIRALAKALGRDYENVHADVSSLESVGLVERTTDGALNAPWDEIEVKGLDSRKLLAVCQGVV